MTTPEKFSHVAIIGAGTIGASWAALVLAKGLKVTIYDPLPSVTTTAVESIKTVWPALQELGVATTPPALDRLTFVNTVAEAVSNADFVQENGPENITLKTPLLVEIDANLPANRVICSSTSGQTIDALRTGLKHPERILVGHPFNPPHLIPLVEVVADAQSSPGALNTAMAFYTSLGKEPLHLSHSIPGHITHRLQMAAWREALYLVERGVVSLQDVDTAMVYGPGIRWAIFGPNTNGHLGGGPVGGLGYLLEALGPAAEVWWKDMASFTKFTPSMIEKLKEGGKTLPEFPKLRADRDRKLVEILKIMSTDD